MRLSPAPTGRWSSDPRKSAYVQNKGRPSPAKGNSDADRRLKCDGRVPKVGKLDREDTYCREPGTPSSSRIRSALDGCLTIPTTTSTKKTASAARFVLSRSEREKAVLRHVPSLATLALAVEVVAYAWRAWI